MNKLMVPIKPEINNIELDMLCWVAETFTIRFKEYVQNKGSHLTDIVLKHLSFSYFPRNVNSYLLAYICVKKLNK